MGLLQKREDPAEGLRRHLKKTTELREEGADFVVWSESSVTFPVREEMAHRVLRSNVGEKLHLPADSSAGSSTAPIPIDSAGTTSLCSRTRRERSRGATTRSTCSSSASTSPSARPFQSSTSGRPTAGSSPLARSSTRSSSRSAERRTTRSPSSSATRTSSPRSRMRSSARRIPSFSSTSRTTHGSARRRSHGSTSLSRSSGPSSIAAISSGARTAG